MTHKIAIICLGLLLASSGTVRAEDLANAGTGEAPEPVFLGLFAGNPRPEKMRLIEEALVALGEQGNKPYLQQLIARTSTIDQRQRFDDAFGCIFAKEKSPGCQHLDLLNDETPMSGFDLTDRMLTKMRERSVQRAWLLNVTEQFFKDGYNLGIGANHFTLVNGKLTVDDELRVMYMHFYSAAADAVGRGLPHTARAGTPAFGSKEARSNFWFEGIPSQIEKLISTSPTEAAKLLRKLLELKQDAPPKEKWLTAKIESLPGFRELDRQGKAACKSSYCSMRVFSEEDDRVNTLGYIGRWPYAVSINRWGFD